MNPTATTILLSLGGLLILTVLGYVAYQVLPAMFASDATLQKEKQSKTKSDHEKRKQTQQDQDAAAKAHNIGKWYPKGFRGGVGEHTTQNTLNVASSILGWM